MEIITDSQAESLRGGRLFSITVAPSIDVSNAVSTSLLGNFGNSLAISAFGGPAFATLGQLNGLISRTRAVS
jgi:hypothetical protein